MIRSMTGFGSTGGTVGGVDYAVEIRAVNNRYLKLSLRLPDSLGGMEPRLEELVRGRLSRGSVTLTVRMKVADTQSLYTLNTDALTQYLEQLKMVEVEANPQFRVDLGSLLQLPGVCQPPDVDELAEQTRDGLLDLVAQAIDELMAWRDREGQTIADDLKTNVDAIHGLAGKIAERKDEVIQLYHDKLKQRVDELIASARISLNEETLAREVAVFAERSDIAEELSRLDAHCKEFQEMLKSPEPAGRKMDFMAQEMLREANTIASKGSDADIARWVVDIKTSIDRIKEQAANVE